MANTIVRFTFLAQDRFSGVVKNINKSLDGLRAKIQSINIAEAKTSKGLGAAFRAQGVAVAQLNSRVGSVRKNLRALGPEASTAASAIGLAMSQQMAGLSAYNAALGDTTDRLRAQRDASVKAASSRKGVAGAVGASAVATNVLGKSPKALLGVAAGLFSVGAIVSSGARMQEAMLDVRAVTGLAEDAAADLQSRILQLAKASGRAGPDIAAALAAVAAESPELRRNIPSLVDLTRKVTLLSNATGAELPASIGAVTQAMDLFGGSAAQVDQFVNVFAELSREGPAVVDSVLRASEAARAAGANFTGVSAAIGLMARSGTPAEKAGEALASIMLKLSRSGTDFQKLGVAGGLEKLAARMQRYGTQQRKIAALSKVVRGEQAASLLVLLENIGGLRQYEAQLSRSNSAQQMADLRLSGFLGKMRQLGANVGEKVITLFERLGPTIEKVAGDIGKWLDSITPADMHRFIDFFSGILYLVRKIGDALLVVAATIKGIGSVEKLIGTQLAAIATLDFGALKESMQFSFKDAFSIGGRLFGIGDAPQSGAGGIARPGFMAPVSPLANPMQPARADINVVIDAPQGAVQSARSQTIGQKSSGLNIGVSMQ